MPAVDTVQNSVHGGWNDSSACDAFAANMKTSANMKGFQYIHKKPDVMAHNWNLSVRMLRGRWVDSWDLLASESSRITELKVQ